MINRRGFFAALFAPIVAKALPAPKPPGQPIMISMTAGTLTATPGSTIWIYKDTGGHGWIIYWAYVTVSASNATISIGTTPQK